MPMGDHRLRKTIERFRFVYRFGLAFAFLKIFAVPSIARVLATTGKLSSAPRERFRATADILMRFVDSGAIGQEDLFTSMRVAHADPRISSESMQYVLSLLMTEPLSWIGASAPGAVNDHVRAAHWGLWGEVGKRMEIPDIPSSFSELELWQAEYERSHQQADAVTASLVEPFLGQILMPMAARMGYPAESGRAFIRNACTPRLRAALGLETEQGGLGAGPSAGPHVALVTGCSSGFGLLTAATLARRGFRVVASMRAIEGRNSASAAQLASLGCRVVPLDVTIDESVRAAIAAILDHEGRIDVLVNNAGLFSFGLDEAFTDAQVQRIFNTNVFGMQRMIRAVLPAMRVQRSGLIVTISSLMAQLTVPFAGIYTASKKAVEGLAESYRYELAPLGVDSILVEPGAFGTSLFRNAIQPAERQRVEEYGAMARLSDRLFNAISGAVMRPTASEPQVVADAIADLATLPFGRRPFRTCIDERQQDAANHLLAAGDEAQSAFLASIGFQPRPPAAG